MRLKTLFIFLLVLLVLALAVLVLIPEQDETIEFSVTKIIVIRQEPEIINTRNTDIRMTAGHYSPDTIRAYRGKYMDMEFVNTGKSDFFTIHELGIDEWVPKGTFGHAMINPDRKGEFDFCDFRTKSTACGRLIVE